MIVDEWLDSQLEFARRWGKNSHVQVASQLQQRKYPTELCQQSEHHLGSMDSRTQQGKILV